jgi:NADPH2:quinone reductase
MTTHAIRLHAYGPPENLKWEEIPVGQPGHGEVMLKQTAIGLNYIDVYQRSGVYQLPSLPATLGQEASGEVLTVGAGVTDLQPGDRVAYAGGQAGAYAEKRVMPADRLIKLPHNISNATAAAMLLKGMTARYLLRMTHKLEAGDTILLHAAAGGTGLIICQWAHHLGAKVIGTVSSKAKADLVREYGCTHPIIYTEGDWVNEVKKITHGRGVPVVYDGVGKNTFAGSLECLAPRGMLVSFGQSSGPIPPIETAKLAEKSLFLTRPRLGDYIASRTDLMACANDVLGLLAAGALKPVIDAQYHLMEAATAHKALESRQTSGASLLVT